MQNENEGKNFIHRTKGKPTRYYLDNELMEWSEALGLKPNDIAVYNALAKHANSRDQSCYPSYETIMRMSRVRNRGTLSNCLRKLEQFNMVRIEHSKGFRSNNYILSDVHCWIMNRDKIDTDVDKTKEPYQNQHTNSVNGASNRINMGTRSHITKSENINHRKNQLIKKFSMDRV